MVLTNNASLISVVMNMSNYPKVLFILIKLCVTHAISNSFHC